MRIACRLFGHKIAHDLIMRDSYTFTQQSYCVRCGTPLERTEGEGWGPPKPVDAQARPPRPELPPLAHPVDGDDVAALAPALSYSDPECRAAYRRGVRELYERSLDKRLAPDRRELAEWLSALDSWRGGDPPPAPDASAIQTFESSAPLPEEPVKAAHGIATTDVVFRVRVEVMAEPNVAIEVENQAVATRSVQDEPAQADLDRAAAPVLQLVIKH